GDRVVASVPLTLTPSGAFTKAFPGLAADKRYTVDVVDGAGKILLAHTEDRFDFAPASEIKLGPQPAYEYPPVGKRTDADFLRLGTDQELDGNLAEVRDALAEAPNAAGAGTLEVALLRRAGRVAEARERARYWRRVDPARSSLRYEAQRLGSPDPALWTHLAGDPERVLDLAVEYMALGAWDDALDVLDRRYPTGAGVYSEPGAP